MRPSVRCVMLSWTVGLAALAAACCPASAAPVTGATTRHAAEAFLAARSGATLGAALAEIRGAAGPLAVIYAVEPIGYLVAATDDALPPVVAYSLEAEYPEADPAAGNPLYQLLAADLESRLRAWPQLSPDAIAARRSAWERLLGAPGPEAPGSRFTQWPPEGTTPTGGWLASNWTQNAPYNALCPLDLAHGGTRSLAGCPAVAMAMILNYHETIQGTTFGPADRYWHNYAGNAYWIPDAAAQYGFPDFTALNGDLQTLTAHWDQGTTLTGTDKAALTFACGVAASQVYSASGSGTFGVDQAFDAYLKFDFSGCRLVFDTDPNLYPDLAADMQEGRPAHLAVVDPGWTMGHNVVVDGYNTDNYFHLNFGWGGSYNGWYLLPQEIPYGLTVVEGVVLDIVPEATAAPEAASSAGEALRITPAPLGARASASFSMRAAGRARLSVFDVLGRCRQIAWEGELTAGPHAIAWDAGALPAGVYLVRLESGDGVASQRAVRVR